MDEETIPTLDEQPQLPTVAIFAATMPEISPTIRRLGLKRVNVAGTHFGGEDEAVRVVAVVSGIGPTNAAAALIRLRDREKIAAVVSIGFAGGLEHGLLAGDLLDLWWLMNADGAMLQITDPVPFPIADPPERTPQRTLLTVDHVVTTIREKRNLYDRYRAASVDMESFQLAKLAVQLNVPFRVVRAISDPAGTALPPEMKNWVKPDGRPDVAAVLHHLVRKPGWLPFVLRLRKETKIAAEAIAQQASDVVHREINRLKRGT